MSLKEVLNHSARCLPLHRVLIVVSAMALGGCSVLPGAKPLASAETPAEGVAQESPEAFSGAQENDASEAPAWNLQTLQTMPGLQTDDDRLTLERAWRLVVENDPEYHAAQAGRAAAQAEIRLGRAAILPQVEAGYSRNKVTGLQRNFTTLGTRESVLDYDSTHSYIQLQQPVFNLGRYAEFQRGKARAQLGDAEFSVRESEAAMRLAAAFLDTLAAQGRSRLTHALAESLEEQAVAHDALFERNEGDRVDAQETRARLALAQADVIAAEEELRVARRQLRAFIGQEPPTLANIDNIDPSLLQLTQPLIHWLERVRANGAAIRTAEARVRVADTEVRRAVARHLPTADLVVALVDADSDNLDSLSQRSNTFQVGLQMAIPIFSGGYDTANHARSRHERRQAEHDLTQAREQSAAEVTRQYTAVQGGAQRIAALMSSVETGEQSLESARQGYRYGINSNLDVLRRQDSLFEARFELLQARAAWLEARIALAVVAGEPVMAVFLAMDQALEQP